MIANWIQQYAGDPEFEFDLLAIDIGERIVDRLEKLKMTRTDLATKIGVSKARISQILSGHDNLTLKSLVAVASGLDSRIELRFRHKYIGMTSAYTEWLPFDTSGCQSAGGEPSVLAKSA